jgi:hypothetical protein
MFLALFFFCSKFTQCSSHSARKQQKTLHNDNPLVLNTTRRRGYLLGRPMDNSQGCPHLILQTICSQVFPRRTSHRIIPHLFHILWQRIYPMNGELINGVDPTTHGGRNVPRVILTLELDTRMKRSWLLNRNQLPKDRSGMRSCNSNDRWWGRSHILPLVLRILHQHCSTIIHIGILRVSRVPL